MFKKITSSIIIGITTLILAIIGHELVSERFDGIYYYGFYGYPMGNYQTERLWTILNVVAFNLYNYNIKNNALKILSLLWFLFHYVPVTVAYIYGLLELYNYTLYTAIALVWIALSNLIVKENADIKEEKTLITSKRRKRLYASVIFTTVVVIVLKIAVGGGVDLYDFFNVYEQRELIDSMGFSTYMLINIIFFGILIPTLFLSAMWGVRSAIILSIINLVIIFTISGSKGMFFNAILMLILMNLTRNYTSLYTVVTKGFILISLASIILSIWDINILLSLFNRRSVELPAQIQYLTMQYYESNPFNYYSKYFSGIVNGVEKLPLPYEIGHKYFFDKTHANAGIVADSYGNLGILSIPYLLAGVFLITRVIDGSRRVIGSNAYIYYFPAIFGSLNVSLIGLIGYKIIPLYVGLVLVNKLVK